MSNEKVWFITGCSSGIGLALAHEVLASGAKAAITARQTSALQELCTAFPDTALALTLDVTNLLQAKDAVEATMEKFGRIDVLVNNAGCGVLGAIEEVPVVEVRKTFETNFFGLLELTKLVLPIMRAQQSGHIINISAAAGLVSTPGLGIVNATKYAVEGLTEALAAEVEMLGISVSLIEPGPFRTNYLSAKMPRFTGIKDYDASRGMLLKILDNYQKYKNQPGDPQQAAKAILQMSETPAPPLRLLLGKYAVERVREKMSDLTDSINAWESVSSNADYKK